MLFNILMIFVGLFLLSLGAESLVKGTSNIAKRFHIPEILIGLTIVSIGTSLPELIVGIESSVKDCTDLILGNSIGSNLCNLLLILGIMALIKPIKIQKETKRVHIPLFFASTILILAMVIQNGNINFNNGIVLIVLFIIYIIYPILLDRKKILEEYKKEKLNNNKETNIVLQIVFIIAGIVLLKFGGDFVIDYATIIAKYYGMSERIIGLTIVALGTSLPELITSIVAIINGDTDIAVGNLLGSSVFNLLLILGVSSIITPVVVSQEIFADLLLLILASFLIWIFCYIPKKDTITRFNGIALVSIFCIYMVKLFI